MKDFNEISNSFNFEESDFSNFEVDFELEFESRYIKPNKSKVTSESNCKYDNAVKLAKNITIEKNTRHFIVINGSFIFGDFIEALIEEKKYKVKSMTISTLSMSENNVDSLSSLLEIGWIDELNLIVSDYFFSHERNNLIPYIYKELDKKNKFQLAVASTHCKLCIFETHCGKYIILHGSANLRSSGNIEQFVCEENEELYNFNLEYQIKIIEKFKTINKAVRNNQLWKTVNH
jgi:hypothetical protein